MTAALSTDQIVGLALVYGTKAEQRAIFRQLKQATGKLCPSCEGDEIEDNDAIEPTYHCCGCLHRWEAGDVEIELPRACAGREVA